MDGWLACDLGTRPPSHFDAHPTPYLKTAGRPVTAYRYRGFLAHLATIRLSTLRPNRS
ncbi:hypothetical protein V3C99_010535 [Haemonchus contortus]